MSSGFALRSRQIEIDCARTLKMAGNRAWREEPQADPGTDSSPCSALALTTSFVSSIYDEQGADLRQLSMKRLEEELLKFGMSQSKIAMLKRWDRVNAVRGLATEAHKRGEEGYKQWARQDAPVPKVSERGAEEEGEQEEEEGYKCGACSQRGHNVRTCPAAQVARPPGTNDKALRLSMCCVILRARYLAPPVAFLIALCSQPRTAVGS